MKNRKLRVACYILAVCNLLLAAALYPSLPDMIPMNWSTNGTVAYNDKIQIFFMSGMGLLMAILFDVLPHIDPRRKNYQKFGPYYDSFCVFMQVFLLLMTGVILTESFRPGTLSVPMITMLCVGALFLFIGNILPKIKSNFYMGIKTPWALSSDEVWRKTHRLGGKCFFLCGIVMVICAFLPSQKFSAIFGFAFVLAVCMIPTVMSYVWWRQEQKTKDTAK